MNRINFLPDSFRAHAARERRRPIEFALIGAVIAGLLALWLYTGGPDRAMAQRVDAIDARIAKIQQLHDEKDRLQAQRSELQRRLFIARETYQPVSMTQTLARLSGLTPEPIRLVAIELHNDRPEPEAPAGEADNKRKRSGTQTGQGAEPRKPNRMKLAIRGQAPSDDEIVTLIRRLDADPVFTSVALRGSRVSQTKTHHVREFQLDVVIDLDRRFVSAGRGEGAEHE